jgi:hypothetical protein
VCEWRTVWLLGRWDSEEQRGDVPQRGVLMEMARDRTELGRRGLVGTSPSRNVPVPTPTHAHCVGMKGLRDVWRTQVCAVLSNFGMAHLRGQGRSGQTHHLESGRIPDHTSSYEGFSVSFPYHQMGEGDEQTSRQADEKMIRQGPMFFC